MSNTKPALVIAHGAWHLPIHFANVVEKLRAAGYDVSVPSMPCSSGTADPECLSKDTAHLKATIETHTNRGQDVILMMHSYGGLYGSEAIAAFHLDPQNSQPGKGRIAHALYVCAVIVPQGVSLVGDDLTAHTLSFEDGLLHHMEPYYRFYEHVPLPVARKCISQLQPQDANSFSTPTKYRGWADYGVPVTYLACKQDKALFHGPDVLKFVGRLREAGIRDLEIVDMDTDHTPWLSREEEFMGLLWKVLTKAEGKGKGEAKI